MGGELKEGGEVDSSSAPEYCSLSEGIVTPDSAIWFDGSSGDMVVMSRNPDRGCPPRDSVVNEASVRNGSGSHEIPVVRESRGRRGCGSQTGPRGSPRAPCDARNRPEVTVRHRQPKKKLLASVSGWGLGFGESSALAFARLPAIGG